VARQCQQIGQVADARELDMPSELDRRVTAPMLQVQLEGLGGKRDRLFTQSTTSPSSGAWRKNASTDGLELPSSSKLPMAKASCLRRNREHQPGEVEQRRRGVALGFDVDGLISVDRVLTRRQIQPAGVGLGESGIAVRGPLHRACAPPSRSPSQITSPMPISSP